MGSGLPTVSLLLCGALDSLIGGGAELAALASGLGAEAFSPRDALPPSLGPMGILCLSLLPPGRTKLIRRLWMAGNAWLHCATARHPS